MDIPFHIKYSFKILQISYKSLKSSFSFLSYDTRNSLKSLQMIKHRQFKWDVSHLHILFAIVIDLFCRTVTKGSKLLKITFLVNEQNVSVVYIDINAVSLHLDLNIFQQDGCFCSKLGMEVGYAKSNLKASLTQIWVICQLLPFVRVGQCCFYVQENLFSPSYCNIDLQ